MEGFGDICPLICLAEEILYTAYLSGHDFSVGARDVYAGVEAGLVVRLHHVAPVHLRKKTNG